ncbi:MAG: phage virion morphogenesis protein [Parvibaculum sp.]|uniref:phage virion morphogenesis protein n=1 Tax=Chelatococcus sp. TaxID=1953771 RepID=UPI001ED72B32|nr:phage virion morphogenesis protein [Chelatococcus sp.]MBX3506840.1 phage virion morphogenesis protein [Parvibaculum sp.]MBX3545587.1 phage virion morphogenesis protein [Chelatococcus sp.]
MSVTIIVDASGLDVAVEAIGRYADLDENELLSIIGDIGESQTRRRIESEKTAPDGSAWPPNQAGTSILLQTGSNLRDSVAYNVGAGEVQWGASWEHAHIHQFGATIKPKSADRLVFMVGGKKRFAKQVTIPARPFVGLSADNAQEITDIVTDFLGALQ